MKKIFADLRKKEPVERLFFPEHTDKGEKQFQFIRFALHVMLV
jgi:hypothetical protein